MEWTPKGPKEVVDNFLKNTPAELLPVKGSAAAKVRKRLLQKQVPLHDIDPTLCHALTEEEVKQMNDYISHIKESSVGVGHIAQFNKNPRKENSRIISDHNNSFVLHSEELPQANRSRILNSTTMALNSNEENLKNLDSLCKFKSEIPEQLLRQYNFMLKDLHYDSSYRCNDGELQDYGFERYYDPSAQLNMLKGKVLNNQTSKHFTTPEVQMQQYYYLLKDLVYEPITGYNKDSLDKYDLEKFYDPERGYNVLKAKRPVYMILKHAQNLNPDLPRFTGKLSGLNERGKLRNLDVYRKYGEEIPEDLLLQYNFMLRDLRYNSSQNCNDEELKKYGFERYYDPESRCNVLRRDLRKEIPGLLPDKFLKNLTPHIIEVPEENLHRYNYILKDLIYEPQKGYREDALDKNGIEKYYDQDKGYNLLRTKYPLYDIPESPNFDFKNKDFPGSNLHDFQNNQIINYPRNSYFDGGTPGYLNEEIARNLRASRDSKGPKNLARAWNLKQLPAKLGSKGNLDVPGNLEIPRDLGIPSDLKIPKDPENPIDLEIPSETKIQSDSKYPRNLEEVPEENSVEFPNHLSEGINDPHKKLLHFAPAKYNRFYQERTPETIKPVKDVAYDPKCLEINQKPINLPKYSDFVKNALAKVENSSETEHVVNPEDRKLPNFDLKTLQISETLQNPTKINIGAINDITFGDVCNNTDETPPELLGLNREAQPDQITSKSFCHKCKKPFNDDDFFIKVDRNDTLWHSDCFKCASCNQTIADLVYFYDKESDDVYCGRDYAKIRGFCRCKACDELIFTKEYCLAENSTFHIRHFCCFECDEPLAGQNYIMENSQPVCIPCYEKTMADKCNSCMNIIKPDEQGVNLNGIHFHGKCFGCKCCGKVLLGSKFMFKNEKLYCSGECFRADR